MKIADKLQKIWENRAKIAEGWYNEYLSHSQEIKEEKERRRQICRGCEYYDPTGTKEIIVVKGKPGCLLCGCNEDLLTASMSSQCSAPKVGLKPRWEAMITPEQEKEINAVEYKKQFENNKNPQ